MTEHALPFAEAMNIHLPNAIAAERAEMTAVIRAEYDAACSYIERRLAALANLPASPLPRFPVAIVQPAVQAMTLSLQAGTIWLIAGLTMAAMFFRARDV